MQIARDTWNVVSGGVYYLFNWKISSTEKVYAEVVKRYGEKKLDMLFPNRGMDKKLEGYIMSFVDRKTFNSMMMVSKSWFLRGYLLRYVNLGDVGDFRMRSELAKGLYLEWGIGVKIGSEKELDVVIEILRKHSKLSEYVKRLDVKFLGIDHKNYKKFEGLFNKLRNLVEVRIGEICAMGHEINLSHDRIESFEAFSLASQKGIILKMKGLKSLSIFTMWGMILGEKGVFEMPNLRECSIGSLDWLKEVIFDLGEVRKVEIGVIGHSEVRVIGPKVEEFNVKKVMSGGIVRLRNFPEGVVEKWKGRGYCGEGEEIIFSDSMLK